MYEELKIRVDKKTAERIRTSTGCEFRQAGTPPAAMFDLRLALGDSRWNEIRQICARADSLLPGFVQNAVSRKPGTPARLPWSRYPGYILLDHERKYTKKEIAAAEWFHADVPVRPVMEREPDEEKAVYDFGAECKSCRFGWKQTGPLTFRESKLKGKFPLFRVFGRNEWLVHQSFRDILEALCPDDAECSALVNLKGRRVVGDWYQLIVKPVTRPCFPGTLFGFDPLYRDPADSGACPHGHTRGLNLLSEVALDTQTLNGSHIAFTPDLKGGNLSIQVPSPLLIVSSQLRSRIIEKFPRSGIRFDIVRAS